MKEIPPYILRMDTPEDCMIVHASGVLLVDRHEPKNPQVFSVLERAGLPFVIVPDAGESLDQMRFSLAYSIMNTSELKEGVILPTSLYDQQDRLLLEAGSTITKNFCDSLERRGIKEILVRKEISESARSEAEFIRKQIEEFLRIPTLQPDMTIHESRNVIESIPMPVAPPEDFSVQKLQARINKLKDVDYKASGEPFAAMVRDTRFDRASEEEKVQLSSLTQECLEMSREIYNWFGKAQMNQATSHGPLGTLNRLASSIMAGVIQHKDIMTLCSIHVQSNEYLPAHSLAVAVVACLIGTRLHLGVAQVKSLIYGALLADVGMLRIPKIILYKRGILDQYERARVKSHPSIGLDMLSLVKDLPLEVPWIVYQSHEKSNGTGYPCGKNGRVIHILAKIVGISDIYVAMCTNRPHRPAHLPYHAMETLLQMAAHKEFDSNLVKAFLETQSLFPVGSLIQLADGRIAQVVSSNPEAYTRPVIVIISDSEGKLLDDVGERINLLDQPDLQIARPLPNPARARVLGQLSGF